MLAISNSEISTADRCMREWYVKYYLGYVPSVERAASSRNLGIRVHVAMEARYGYDIDPMAVLEMLYAIEREQHPDEELTLKAEQELAEIIVGGYLEWAVETGDEADWQVVATETDLRVPLPEVPGVELRVRMDQVARRISDGSLAFRDWKTVADFDKHDILANDPQMRFYCMVQQLAASRAIPPHTHEDDGTVEGCPGCFTDVPLVTGGRLTSMRRVKRTERAKPPFYRSDDFWFNPHQIHATRLRTASVCRKIVAARAMLDEAGTDLRRVNVLQQSELHPTWIQHDCSWRCPFASGLCASMDDGSDWAGILTSSGHYKQDDPYAYYERNPLATLRAAVSGDGA